MKTALYLYSIALILSGCLGTGSISKTSGLSHTEIAAIPPKAKIIYLDVPGATPQQVHEQIVSALLSRGHRIQTEDKERFYITTEGKDVGESTLQRMVIVTQQSSNATNTKITTEWKAGAQAATAATAMSGVNYSADWAEARFGENRLGIAIAESVAVAKKIPGGVINYGF